MMRYYLNPPMSMDYYVIVICGGGRTASVGESYSRVAY
jgi:hypothetical protein